MEKLMKGYVFKLYPNEKQKELIEKSFGCSRYVYNYFLGKNKNYINVYESIKELPKLVKENNWLKEVDSCLLRCAIFNLEDSFKRYSKNLGNYPKFKSRNKTSPSYRTNNISSTYKGKTYNSISVDLKNKVIKLPKLKKVKIGGYRNLKEINGRIINSTIYKEANKYYVSICVEQFITIPKIIPAKIIGMDLGIKDLLITSDGYTIENKHIIEKYEKKIKGLNKWLSRSKVGSKNRYKIIKKIQTVYKKLKNARKYLLHSISNKIISENDVIVTERLKINEMVQNKHLSKKIYDASWHELIRQLEYKSKWNNKRFYQIDTYYPSSQICSRCGYMKKEIKDLKIRKWECISCTNINERDINASINIMFEGIKKYMKGIKELQVI
jgi:putative transposase